MDIICATDNNYVQHCGVMLTSLFENNKGEEIHVYVLTEGLSEICKKSIENIISNYNGYFHYCKIDQSYFEKCPIRKGDHVSIVAYYRFLIPQVLPENQSKALYLDCDIIIRKSLKELWDLELSGYALAAVDETQCQPKDVFLRLQYDSVYKYFNSGVLLINIDYWRNNNITNQLFNYINTYPDRAILHDQDTLNAVLHNQWLQISTTWNMGETFYRNGIYSDNKDVNDNLKDPAILHYTWRPKPWNYGCNHPLKEEYFKYLEKTQWKRVKAKILWKRWLRNHLRAILVFFKIKQPYYKKI